MHVDPGSPADPARATVPGARAALALLICINLFNYIDRQILSAVLPRLELDGTLFSPTDPNLKFKLGLLPSAFLVAYMLFSPLVGWLDGHGYRRWVILGLGVSVWSLASGGSGFATGYWILFLTRCLVGIGEGAYGPVASALIADMYAPQKRATALAAFNMAIPVGSALGFVIGGAVADYFDDWRHAFWFTFSGLILGTICFFKRELPRPTTARQQADAPSYGEVLMRLLKNRSFIYCCLGMTAVTFVLGGVAAWVPTYIFQRESRFLITTETFNQLTNPPHESKRRAVPPDTTAKLQPLADGVERDYARLKANAKSVLTEPEMQLYFEPLTSVATTGKIKLVEITSIFGGIVVVGGFLATLFATWLGERWKPRMKGAYFWVIGGGALAAFPAFVSFLFLPLPWGWVCVFVAVVGLFMHVGPGNTILANVVTSEMRATAFAINILVIHALGDVISPPLIGAVADRFGWQTSLIATSLMILLGGGLWCYGARYLDEDTERAS